MLVVAALLGVLSADPWNCPEQVCGPAPPAVVEPGALLHARQLRDIMRAFGRLDGERPWFTTSAGHRLRPSMSARLIEAIIREDEGIPEFTAHYGRCATHSWTCPWASVTVALHEAGSGCGEAKGVARTTETATHRVREFEHVPPESEFDVDVPPPKCGANRAAGAGRDQSEAAHVSIGGTLGRGRRALGQLPVRAILGALASRS